MSKENDSEMNDNSKPERLHESGEAAKRASEQLNRNMNAGSKSENNGQGPQCREKGFSKRFNDER